MSDFTLYNDLQRNILPVTGPEKQSDSGFSNALKDAVKEVNALEEESNVEVEKFLNNESDLHSVMIALEKADLSFQVMMQVRNKIVQAYQEIMRTQV